MDPIIFLFCIAIAIILIFGKIFPKHKKNSESHSSESKMRNFIKSLFRPQPQRSQNHDVSCDIIAMAKVIADLKKENEGLLRQIDEYRNQISDLRAGKEKSDDYRISPYDISQYFQEHGLSYEIVNEECYVRIISRENSSTVSFNREFDKSKSNHNWVDEGYALITLKLDNASFPVKGPTTIIKSPCSGIFESNNNKLIRCDEEICRIKKYDSAMKSTVLDELERQSIKNSVLAKEQKKAIERETLDELIAEGKVFNTATLKSGKRISIPREVASAVWNRDGGQCCICGSKADLEFDHIIPISKGGATTFRNLQILCKTCNLKKLDNI